MAAAITYEFKVAGQCYESNALDVVGRGAGWAAGDVLATYAVGNTVTVRFDPQRPTRSLLVPGAGRANYLMLTLGLMFLVLGVLWLLATLLPSTK